MNEKNETVRNLLGLLFFAALLLFLTLAIVRVGNAASVSEYLPEKELVSLQTLGSVEMLPTQPGEGMPPQASPENGMPPQFDGSQSPNPADGNGVVPPPQTAENGEATQPFAGMPPQFPGQGAPPQQFGGMPPQFDGQGAPQFPPEPPNFGRSTTALGPVQVDGKTWAILIVESVILALGIAFASLYKKERP